MGACLPRIQVGALAEGPRSGRGVQAEQSVLAGPGHMSGTTEELPKGPAGVEVGGQAAGKGLSPDDRESRRDVGPWCAPELPQRRPAAPSRGYHVHFPPGKQSILRP